MEPLETFDVDGVTVKLYPDDSPDSPRDWDNVAVMACDHRRYDLGDGTLADLIGRDLDGFKSMAHLKRYLGIAKDAAVVMPLYLIDHSGISMSTGSFNYCDPQGWDSGIVGIAWVTRAKARAELIANEGETLADAARRCIQGEVATYDQYLTGDVYGYVVESQDGTHLDSCWGFYGIDEVRSEARSMAEACAAAEAKAETWAARQGIPTIA